MKTQMIIATLVMLAFGTSSILACSACGCTPADTAAASHTHQEKLTDIVHTAEHAGQFKTLVAALQAADLDEALQGSGPFTVFAPTDSAFAALPKGTVASLLLPENKAKLQSILKYHVVPGRIMSSDVIKYSDAKLPAGTVESFILPENKAKLQAILKYHVLAAKLNSNDIIAAHTVKTLNGEALYPSLMVDNAAIQIKNIYCSNGVIHVIDNVILPKEEVAKAD